MGKLIREKVAEKSLKGSYKQTGVQERGSYSEGELGREKKSR